MGLFLLSRSQVDALKENMRQLMANNAELQQEMTESGKVARFTGFIRYAYRL